MVMGKAFKKSCFNVETAKKKLSRDIRDYKAQSRHVFTDLLQANN